MPPNQGERMSAEATVELTWDMAARAGLEDPESHIFFLAFRVEFTRVVGEEGRCVVELS